MKPSTFMWTDNRPVLLQIDGPYGRNGLIIPTKHLTSNIASSAFTLDCLFIVNKAWGTHFYRVFHLKKLDSTYCFGDFLWHSEAVFGVKSSSRVGALTFRQENWHSSSFWWYRMGILIFTVFRKSQIWLISALPWFWFWGHILSIISLICKTLYS